MQGVVILFFALLAWGSSLSWGACESVNSTICNPFGQYTCNEPQWDQDPYCTSTGCYSGCVKEGSWVNCSVRCDTRCDADSLKCVTSGGEGASWNSGNCTCDTLAPPDTSYRCVNESMPSSTYGERPISRIYRCITTGSSSDVCTLTSTLNGTCDDWDFCEKGVYSCIIPPDDTTHKVPCTRSGAGTTSSGRCYYQCPDGTGLSCSPTSTEYVAGNIYVGVCPDRPPKSCLPPSPGSSTSSLSSSSSDILSSSSEVRDTIPPDTIDSGVNLDYGPILNAIRDTLHKANEQREILKDWDLDFMRPVKFSVSNIEDYAMYNWQKTDDINNQLTTLQDRPFNLSDDIKQDLDSSRLLLDEIKQFLKNDSLRTYSTDTTYSPLLREIAGKLDSTGSVDSTYGLLKPFFKDSGQYKSPITRFLESFSSNFERSNEDESFCSSYYSCLSGGGRMDCVNRFPGASERCISGGSPLDGVINLEVGIIETIVDAIFGSDSTPIPRNDDSDSVDVLPPGFSSASAELERANDSLGSFNLGITLDSVRSMLDSARKMNSDTTKIQPDSLWLDSSAARQYVEHILLPSGTGTDCFMCHADLGTFGGLTDTTLKIHIDFSDFGGYNWCEIIRAVVRIATLVVCISLTLGSWAAAFGYNPKNDA